MKDHLESSIFGDTDDHEATGFEAEHRALSRRERRRARKEEQRVGGKPSTVRRLVVIVLALAVVGVGAFVAVTLLRPLVASFTQANDYAGPGTGEVQVKVSQGDGGTAIAKTLREDDIVKTTKAFIEAANADPRSAGIQPGVYALRKQMSAADALAVLVDPKNRITSEVTIPEGLWAKEIYPRLSKATGVPVADYTTAAKDAKALGLPAAAKGNVEGYLFPAGYTFDPGTSAAAQLRTMVGETVKRLDALGVPEAQRERIMTIASLVEAEARFEKDRPKVARVVENRLADKMPLQLDSTVNYASGKHGITTTNAARGSASPYNTYKVVGLPPGPIDNPGESAIKAAVSPAAGPWLYFVTTNPETGETKFAETYAEHQKNVQEFQTWCQSNKGKC